MTHPTSLVDRLWGTGVVVGEIDLAGILRDDIARYADLSGGPLEHVSAAEVLREEDRLGDELLLSMNALAAASETPPVADLRLDVQVWRGGFDLPAVSYPAAFVGWCILAASGRSQHSESGAIALADPRAGSALTAMPGLPWGRQVLIRPTPGAHATAPGWLTCSVVPMEEGQYAVVAVATSVP